MLDDTLGSLDKLYYRKKVYFRSSGGDAPTWDDSSHICWKDWEGDSGQEQCWSRRILLINKKKGTENLITGGLRLLVFVSKQVFVPWFFQTPFPVLLGNSRDFPILCDFRAFLHTLPQGDLISHIGKVIALLIFPFSSFPLMLFLGGQITPGLGLISSAISASPWTPSDSSTFPWSSPWPCCCFPCAPRELLRKHKK